MHVITAFLDFKFPALRILPGVPKNVKKVEKMYQPRLFFHELMGFEPAVAGLCASGALSVSLIPLQFSVIRTCSELVERIYPEPAELS